MRYYLIFPQKIEAVRRYFDQIFKNHPIIYPVLYFQINCQVCCKIS